MKLKLQPHTLLCITLFFSLTALSQSESDSLKLNGYLFDHFTNGTVLLKTGVFQNALLNYNMTDQVIVFKNGGQSMVVTNYADIDTVYIEQIKLIPVNEKFYEFIAPGKVVLLAKYNWKLHPVTATTDHNGTSRQSTDEVSNTVSGAYVSQNYKGNYNLEVQKQYWLNKYNRLYKANNLSQVIKLFPAKEALIKNYVKDQKINLNKEEDMIKLISYCNE